MGHGYFPSFKEKNDQYTLSFDMNWTNFNARKVYIDLYCNKTTSTILDITDIINQNLNTKHISATFSISSLIVSTSEFEIRFYSDSPNGNGTLRIKNLQVEKGNLESDWRPAIEDVKITSVNNMNIACGSKIVVTKAATSVAVFSFADLNSIFSASDCDKTNTMCIFANGDGSLQSVHIDGATVSGNSWYATFGSTATSGDMRINYTVIYFGESATSVLADGDEVSY